MGVVCFYFFGSFCGGLGFVILIDKMFKLREEVMCFVCVVFIVLEVKDWRFMYCLVGFMVGEVVVVVVIKGGLVEL